MARDGHKPGGRIQSGAETHSQGGQTMKEEQRRKIENRLTIWSGQSFKAMERWTKYSDEGKTVEAAAMDGMISGIKLLVRPS